MQNEILIGLVILFPLVGFLLNFCLGKRVIPDHATGWIATFAMLCSFLVTLVLWNKLHGLDPEARKLVFRLWNWIPVGDFQVEFKYVFDPLSALMCMIITGIGTLIHLYSTSYMHDDHSQYRFFSYLNLFVFSMLNLVLAANLLVLFIGWEGVGLCSYLLIGFWFSEEKNATAGKKAFITNRVGDLGLILGSSLIFLIAGSLDFETINQYVTTKQVAPGLLTAATLLLFLGATGKSAQIPLYIWLPDAMAGPTPVSALIHAATMVTAGVFMIARLNGLFIMAPDTLTVIMWVGTLTAFFAATIGIAQTDIKKVLAYSTVSQLGFMFMAMGAGAFPIGMFHLMTHAFFKACLFLGSGSVIHALHGEQDIRKMGGLAQYLPITYATWFLAWLAICGIPPFSGFMSKDEILWNVFNSHSGGAKFAYGIGLLSALCTAFYMTRVTALTFWGKFRGTHEQRDHMHESPWAICIPLVILGLLSFLGGFLSYPSGWPLGNVIPNVLHHWLEPSLSYSNKVIEAAGVHEHSHVLEYGLALLSVAVASFGIFMGRRFYRTGEVPAKMAKDHPKAYQLLLQKYFVDELLEKYFYRPLRKISDLVLFKVMDRKIIDGSVNESGILASAFSSGSSLLQSGNAHWYALYFIIGVALILGLVVV